MGNTCCSAEAVEGKTRKLQQQEEQWVARSELMQLLCTSPEPEGCTIEARELETVLAVLQRLAVKLGLKEEDGRLLKMLFSENEVPHDSTVKAAGFCDQALFGVDREALKSLHAQRIDLLKAAKENRVEEVRLVCKWAPERVNRDKDTVSVCDNSAYNAGLLSVCCAGEGRKHRAALGCGKELCRGDGAASCRESVVGHQGPLCKCSLQLRRHVMLGC